MPLITIEHLHVHLHGVSDPRIMKELHKMAKTLDDVQADVNDERTVVDSAIALLNGLSDQLKATQGDPAKVQAIIDAIDAQKADLAAAITANTPAAPPVDTGTGSDAGGPSVTDTTGDTSGTDTTGAGDTTTDTSGGDSSAPSDVTAATGATENDGTDTTSGAPTE